MTRSEAREILQKYYDCQKKHDEHSCEVETCGNVGKWYSKLNHWLVKTKKGMFVVTTETKACLKKPQKFINKIKNTFESGPCCTRGK